MALKDAIAKHSYRRTDVCPVARLIERLSVEDQKALQEAIDNRVAVYSIAKALRSEGHRVAELTIGEHIKKNCRCFAK
jgi:hypothetical protein